MDVDPAILEALRKALPHEKNHRLGMLAEGLSVTAYRAVDAFDGQFRPQYLTADARSRLQSELFERLLECVAAGIEGFQVGADDLSDENLRS